MTNACIKVAKSNVEIYEILYKMHLTKDTFFYSEEFTETLLIAIAANLALTKRMTEEVEKNTSISFYTTKN